MDQTRQVSGRLRSYNGKTNRVSKLGGGSSEYTIVVLLKPVNYNDDVHCNPNHSISSAIGILLETDNIESKYQIRERPD